MRYTPLSAATYREHRARFRQAMDKGGLAVFHSNDIMPTSADGHMPFKQASDIFYLSGIDQEETILLLFPDGNSRDVQALDGRTVFTDVPEPASSILVGLAIGLAGIVRCRRRS